VRKFLQGIKVFFHFALPLFPGYRKGRKYHPEADGVEDQINKEIDKKLKPNAPITISPDK
jgi:hypothetical protein